MEAKIQVADKVLETYKSLPFYSMFSKQVKGSTEYNISKTVVYNAPDDKTDLLDEAKLTSEMLAMEAVQLGMRKIGCLSPNFNVVEYKNFAPKLEEYMEEEKLLVLSCELGVPIYESKHFVSEQLDSSISGFDRIGKLGKLTVYINAYLPAHLSFIIPLQWLHFEIDDKRILEEFQVVRFNLATTVDFENSKIFYATEIPTCNCGDHQELIYK